VTPEPVPGELPEMLWYDGRFARSIRVDAPVDPAAGWEAHAHIFDPDGAELIVVNRDGSARHGLAGALHPDDAAVLRAIGFDTPEDGEVR
jgi:hypothetical protein